MTEKTDDFARRFQAAFAIRNEYARRETLLELIAQIRAGAPVTPEAWQVFADATLRETSDLVLVKVWSELAKLEAPDVLIQCARRALASGLAVHRQIAVRFLAKVCPDERRSIHDQMASEQDPFVLCEVAWAILPEDVEAAVRVWIRAMNRAPAGMADEVIPAWIGRYGGAQAIPIIQSALADAPNSVPLRMALWWLEQWNRVEYLDNPSHEERGRGYCSKCPGCGKNICLHDGHEGERARCRDCATEFPLPAPPGKKD